MITIDAASPIPPFEQIRAQYAREIASGQLPPGTRLPTVRRLAADLGLAVNTVLRAYQELIAADLIVSNGRAGTIVAATPGSIDAELLAAAQDYAAIAHHNGVSRAHAMRTISVALDADRAPSQKR